MAASVRPPDLRTHAHAQTDGQEATVISVSVSIFRITVDIK